MRNKIFIACSTFGEYGREPLRLLEESGFGFYSNPTGKRLTEAQIIEMGRDSVGIIAGVEPYTRDVLGHLPFLRCISRCGVGIDNIDQQTAREKNIRILNTPDVVIQPVAEMTVAMIFDLLRHLTWHTNHLRTQQWKKKAGYLLKGKKIGILGLGRIGRRTAEILACLEAEVLGVDLVPDQEWAHQRGVRILALDEMLASVDVLSIHLSERGGQPFLLGAKEIALMKQGAMIVNVSRGHFLDEGALYEALKNGHLQGAALDVYPEEPYRGKLTELDNVVLTPHIATLTEESRLEMEIQATRNLVNFLKLAE